MTDLQRLMDLGAKLLKTLDDDQLAEDKVPMERRLDWLRRRIQCLHGMVCEHCFFREPPSAMTLSMTYERPPLKPPF